jgi:hypothetical protein
MASPDQSPSWDREERCGCKGCGRARKEGAEDLAQRVRKLHFDNGFGNCITCHISWENGFSVSVFPVEYPCPTIQALDGEKK